MSFQANVYRILVGGPSDVAIYRKIATEVILRWNHDHADDGIVLLPGLWEDDTRPQRGDHPQSIVNRQLVDRCDAMIAMFSGRLGSPTPTHESGTVEEVERVHEEDKEVMVYFYGGKVDQEIFKDKEYTRLQTYKEQFRKRNLVYSFTSEENLAGSLSSHLNKLVKDMASEDETISVADAEQAARDQDSEPLDFETELESKDQDPYERFVSVLEASPFNQSAVEEALADYCSSEVTDSDKHRADLHFRLSLLAHGNTSMLSELRAIAHKESQSDEDRRRSFAVLGMAYDHLKNFRKSEEAYGRALALASDPEQKALIVANLASSLHNQGKFQESIQLIERTIAETVDDLALLILFERIADLYRDSGEHDAEGMALQQAILHGPDRTDLYFHAARGFDVAGLDELELLYYRTLIGISPMDRGALNNVGLTYEGMNLNMLAVDSYRRSFELGNTLAGANLAYTFLNAGFAAEASRVLEEARSQPSPQRNVFEAMAAIGRKRDYELETEDTLLKRGRVLQEFLNAYANRFFEDCVDNAEFSGSWRSEAGEFVTIEQSGPSIAAHWKTLKYQYSFNGEVSKSTAVLGEIKSKPEDKSAWSSTTHAKRGYLYLSDDGDIAHILGINDPMSHLSLYTKTLRREREV